MEFVNLLILECLKVTMGRQSLVAVLNDQRRYEVVWIESSSNGSTCAVFVCKYS